MQWNVNSSKGQFFAQFNKVDLDLVALNTRANHQRKDIIMVENQQTVFAEQITELLKEVRELKEMCARKDEHIHMLEATMELLEVTVDSYANTIKTSQTRVYCCNRNVVRITSERELR